MLFEQLGLSTNILRAIADEGYVRPTPIQEKAIPAILEGKDVMGGAQTGTGKTAGFTLPMLRRLEKYESTSRSPAKHPVRALILVPTRELAIQVSESIKTYGKYTNLKSTLVYGGVNIDTQVESIRNGVEILVATPGRLLDHLQQKYLSLSRVEVLILDEADRMLDMGFLPDIRKILDTLPENRQNLMFSATFSNEIKKLANQLLNEPVLIEVAKSNSINNLITHVVYMSRTNLKAEHLVHLLKEKNLDQVLIFSRTKSGVDRLKKYMDQHGIVAAAIHGDKNQLQRCQAFNDFKQGRINVLVATDVAARGLDIDELSCVINFELPTNPEDYIHRIGRTGRAGSKGYAISLVSPEEKKQLVEIEKLLQKKIQVEQIDYANKKQNEKLKAKNTSPQRDKKAGRGEPKQNHRSTVSDLNIAEVIYFNGKHINREIKSNKANKHDPLFTQPYVSTKSEHELNNDSVLKTTKKRQGKRNYNRGPVPALFAPPVNK